MGRHWKPRRWYNLLLCREWTGWKQEWKDEKTTLRMGENNCKWSNRQRINPQNLSSSCSSLSETQTTQSKNGQKTSTDISPKTYRWPTNTQKDAQNCSLLDKCKSKPQWGIISHQSEWPSSKNLQTINAGEGVEKKEPTYIVGGNVNWYSHYGEQYWRFLNLVLIEMKTVFILTFCLFVYIELNHLIIIAAQLPQTMLGITMFEYQLWVLKRSWEAWIHLMDSQIGII